MQESFCRSVTGDSLAFGLPRPGISVPAIQYLFGDSSALNTFNQPNGTGQSSVVVGLGSHSLPPSTLLPPPPQPPVSLSLGTQ